MSCASEGRTLTIFVKDFFFVSIVLPGIPMYTAACRDLYS